MRKSINAIVNVIRFGARRNREAVVARGVDALRASGPGYCMHPHAHPTGLKGQQSPREGLVRLLDLRSSLDASSAWQSLSAATSECQASSTGAGACFTGTTCTTTPWQVQVLGRSKRRAALKAAHLPVACLLASA